MSVRPHQKVRRQYVAVHHALRVERVQNRQRVLLVRPRWLVGKSPPSLDLLRHNERHRTAAHREHLREMDRIARMQARGELVFVPDGLRRARGALHDAWPPVEEPLVEDVVHELVLEEGPESREAHLRALLRHMRVPRGALAPRQRIVLRGDVLPQIARHAPPQLHAAQEWEQGIDRKKRARRTMTFCGS